MTFTTSLVLSLPTVTTSSVATFTSTTALLGGNVTSDGNATVTERGICYSTSQNPTIANIKTPVGSGTGFFSTTVIGLTANTTYFVKAYAINSQGTAYGNQVSFTSSSAGNETGTLPYNGYIYKTVRIGTQWWFAENLQTTKYYEGTVIQNVTDNVSWPALTTGAYCWFNNDITNRIVYGALYNWHAVNTGKLCPSGWHVPSDSEWRILESYLGGDLQGDGGKMKSTTGWNSPNTGATNESGFSGLPGGGRSGLNGTFGAIANYGYFWSSSEVTLLEAWARALCFDNPVMFDNKNTKGDGYSIRCLKD